MLLKDPDHTATKWCLLSKMTACVALRQETHREAHKLGAEVSSVGREWTNGAGLGPLSQKEYHLQIRPRRHQ